MAISWPCIDRSGIQVCAFFWLISTRESVLMRMVGGEMGNWDDELISLLPSSCKIYASAGAGFDWVDTERLAKRGKFLVFPTDCGGMLTEVKASFTAMLRPPVPNPLRMPQSGSSYPPSETSHGLPPPLGLSTLQSSKQLKARSRPIHTTRTALR